MFKIIACVNQEGVIGNDGKLLYTIKADLKNFRNQTLSNVVIMGRKTFESLPNGKPLEGRINIVITSNKDYCVDDADNIYVVNSIEDAVELCEAFFEGKELFVIGGEAIYKEFLERGLVDEMRLTVVKDSAEGDAHFPKYDESQWRTYYKSMAQVSTWEGIDKTFYFQVLKKA